MPTTRRVVTVTIALMTSVTGALGVGAAANVTSATPSVESTDVVVGGLELAGSRSDDDVWFCLAIRPLSGICVKNPFARG